MLQSDRDGVQIGVEKVAPLGRLAARLPAKGIPVVVKDVSERAEGIPELERNFESMVELGVAIVVDQAAFRPSRRNSES